jgi:hypothetical protein
MARRARHGPPLAAEAPTEARAVTQKRFIGIATEALVSFGLNGDFDSLPPQGGLTELAQMIEYDAVTPCKGGGNDTPTRPTCRASPRLLCCNSRRATQRALCCRSRPPRHGGRRGPRPAGVDRGLRWRPRGLRRHLREQGRPRAQWRRRRGDLRRRHGAVAALASARSLGRSMRRSMRLTNASARPSDTISLAHKRLRALQAKGALGGDPRRQRAYQGVRAHTRRA